MIKKAMIFALVLFLLSNVSSQCNETQVDINSAPLEELMKIKGLGGEGIIAGRVIENRPYNSLDGLLEVKGIGNTTLTKIKSQGLACVSNEEESDEKDSSEEVPENKTAVVIEETSLPEKESYYFPENASLPKISINSQTIKTSDNGKISSDINYAVLGLAGFCVLLGTLFAIKKLRRKNEFRE